MFKTTVVCNNEQPEYVLCWNETQEKSLELMMTKLKLEQWRALECDIDVTGALSHRDECSGRTYLEMLNSQGSCMIPIELCKIELGRAFPMGKTISGAENNVMLFRDTAMLGRYVSSGEFGCA